MLPGLTVPEPTNQGYEADAFADAPSLPRAVCDYIDFDAVNALGVVEYSDTSGFGDFCTLSQLDFEQGFHSLTVFVEAVTLDEARTWLPDAEELSIEGYPALYAQSLLYVGMPDGTVTFSVALPEAATQAGVEPTDILVPVAEMVMAAVVADTAE